MLWHFSIMDTPSLLFPNNTSGFSFPSTAACTIKGYAHSPGARLLSSTSSIFSSSFLLLSLEFPLVHIHSSQQGKKLSRDNGVCVTTSTLRERHRAAGSTSLAQEECRLARHDRTGFVS